MSMITKPIKFNDNYFVRVKPRRWWHLGDRRKARNLNKFLNWYMMEEIQYIQDAIENVTNGNLN